MKSKNRIIKNIVMYALLTGGLIVVALPMIYMVSTSLKPNAALYEFPPRFFPKLSEITLENYAYVLHQSKFYLNFLILKVYISQVNHYFLYTQLGVQLVVW